MITISTKKSVRKPADSFVNLSRMDYELVCRVLQLLDETGLDDEEFSFLIGKRNQYFFDIIDPRKKQKLKTDQVDPLAAIFGKPHRKIIPLFIKPGEMIHIHHATRKVEEDEETKTITYSHIIYPRGSNEGIKIVWEKKFAKGVRHKLNNTVLQFLEQKIEAGYFQKPRLTLPLYLEMKKKLGAETFTAMDLERALAKLMRSQGPLMYTSIDTQNHYFERHEVGS